MVQSLIFTAESTKFKITVVVFPGIFQDESTWLYASYGHAPDLIRLIQSGSCGTKSNFTAVSTKFKITVVVFSGIFQDESAWLYASYAHAPSRP